MDEFQFIKKNITSARGGSLILGAGDDCSVIDFSDSQYMVSSSDCLVEGVHFRKKDISMEELAFKSLAVNISDVVAMGATPKWVHLSFAIPPQVSEAEAKIFFSSFQKLASDNNIQLAGGDLSRSPSSIFINVHITGLVEKEYIQWRASFTESQKLCVTGSLGDSAAGLKCLIEGVQCPPLVEKHFKPPIDIEQGCWLARRNEVRGMMDLSDGLLSDIQWIGGLNIKIHLERLPLSNELKEQCESKGWDPFELALVGGEDYRLLFGCKDCEFEKLRFEYRKQFDSEIYCIGDLEPGVGETLLLKDGKPWDLNYKTFQHFNGAND